MCSRYQENPKLPGVGLSFKWSRRGMVMQTWKTCKMHTIILLLLRNNMFFFQCTVYILNLSETSEKLHINFDNVTIRMWSSLYLALAYSFISKKRQACTFPENYYTHDIRKYLYESQTSEHGCKVSSTKPASKMLISIWWLHEGMWLVVKHCKCFLSAHVDVL